MPVLDHVGDAAETISVPPFRSLIVALDLLEEGGDRALPTVSALARVGNVPLELLTVSSPNLSEDVDAYELERRTRATGWPQTAYTILHDEDPAAAIARHVAERPDALLVMATSAKPALTGLFLGSVSEAVLSRVDQPVLLIGPRVGPASRTVHPTLVACVDNSAVAERAVPAITRWMHTFDGGPPWVVEVVGGPATTARPGTEASGAKSFARMLAEHDVEASWEVLHGDDPDLVLVEFGTRLRDPIFVATSMRWTDGRLHWHSTTRKLVQRASRPVLVIPAGDG